MYVLQYAFQPVFLKYWLYCCGEVEAELLIAILFSNTY